MVRSLSTLDRLAQVSPVNVTKTAPLTASSSQQKLLFERTALKSDDRKNPFPTEALKSLIEMDRGGPILGGTDHRAYQEPIFPVQGLLTRSLTANQASQETEKLPSSQNCLLYHVSFMPRLIDGRGRPSARRREKSGQGYRA